MPQAGGLTNVAATVFATATRGRAAERFEREKQFRLRPRALFLDVGIGESPSHKGLRQ